MLLKVVSYYDLSVLSMSVMGFQNKKVWMWVGGVSSIQFFWDFLNFFNFAKCLMVKKMCDDVKGASYRASVCNL